MSKFLRAFEQPFTDFVIAQNNKLNERLNDSSTHVPLKDILKVHLLGLLPDLLFGSLVKNFNQWHLSLFFIWQRYYELAKRLTRVIYKYEYGLEGKHQISYLRPGQIIMFTIVL